MVDPLSVALLAGGGLLLARGFASRSTVSVPPVSATIPPLGGSGGNAPVPGTIAWPPGPGQPGYITLGGQPAPASYSLGNLQTAIQASGVATSITGATLGIGSAVGATAPGGALAAGTAAGTAIPIIGIGVAAVGLVLGIIAKHHAEAVAREANGLNQAVPIIKQRYVLIVQAGVRGELTQVAADTLIREAVDDYYTMVKSITQGHWTYILPAGGSLDETINTHLTGGKKPGTCNGPCVIGHDVIEPNGIQVSETIAKILAGKHGTMTFQDIASHAGFAGFPKVQVLY